MDVELDSQHQLLRDSARRFFETECPLSRVRQLEASAEGFSRDTWRRMAELGWLGLGLPEELGGSGGDALDLYVLGLEMGRSLVSSPFLPSTVIAGSMLLRAGSDQQLGELLPAMSRGELIAIPALREQQIRVSADSIQLEAQPTSGGYSLTGTKLLVPYANSADRLLCLARRSDRPEPRVHLFIVDREAPGLRLEAMPSVSGEPLFAVSFENVEVARERVLEGVTNGWEVYEMARSRGIVTLCGIIAGAAERVLEMTVSYAQHRKQFGRPIGQFQLVQSLCVDIAADTHRMGLLGRQAAWALESEADPSRATAEAGAFGSRAIRRVVHHAHEVHAGIAFMLDHDLQLFTRRAKRWELELGGSREHLEALADALEI